MNDTDLIIWAQKVATRAHHETGQMRRGEIVLPYIAHPLRVGILVAANGGSDVAIAAGILHDVIEDTPEDYENWPEDVVTLVKAVTKLPGETKLASVERLVNEPEEALLIKLADRVDNSTAEDNGWSYFCREDVLLSTRRLVEIVNQRNYEEGYNLARKLQSMLDGYDDVPSPFPLR